MTKIQQAWDKTAGYKTASGGVLLLLFQLFKLIYPNALQADWEEWIDGAIGLIITTGILDKILRSRKKIAKFFNKIFTKKNK